MDMRREGGSDVGGSCEGIMAWLANWGNVVFVIYETRIATIKPLTRLSGRQRPVPPPPVLPVSCATQHNTLHRMSTGCNPAHAHCVLSCMMVGANAPL